MFMLWSMRSTAAAHAGETMGSLRRHRLDLQLPRRIEQLAAHHGHGGPVVAEVLHAHLRAGLAVGGRSEVHAHRYQIAIVHVRRAQDRAEVLPDELGLLLEGRRHGLAIQLVPVQAADHEQPGVTADLRGMAEAAIGRKYTGWVVKNHRHLWAPRNAHPLADTWD